MNSRTKKELVRLSSGCTAALDKLRQLAASDFEAWQREQGELGEKFGCFPCISNSYGFVGSPQRMESPVRSMFAPPRWGSSISIGDMLSDRSETIRSMNGAELQMLLKDLAAIKRCGKRDWRTAILRKVGFRNFKLA